MYKTKLTSAIILLILANLLSTCIYAEEKPNKKIVWHTNFEESQQQAEKDGKLILLYFSGSDWCRPCIQLKIEVFESDPFKNFTNEKFILTQFDFPAQKAHQLPKVQRLHNEQMAEKYNPAGSFPFVVIIDYQGEKIGELNGYKREGAEAYINKLKKLINTE